MSGRVISIFFSPSENTSRDLFKKVISCLAAKFGMVVSEAQICSIEYNAIDDDWVRVDSAEDDGERAFFDFAKLHEWVSIDASLWSGAIELYSRIDVHPMSRTDNRPCVTLSFGSNLHRQLYPEWGAMQAEEGPKKALTVLCLEMAEQIGATAFLIDFNDNGLLRGIDARELAMDMLHPEGKGEQVNYDVPYVIPGRFMGVSDTLLSRDRLADAWGANANEVIRVTVSGYVVLDFL